MHNELHVSTVLSPLHAMDNNIKRETYSCVHNVVKTLGVSLSHVLCNVGNIIIKKHVRVNLTLEGLCIIFCNIYTFQQDTQCSCTDCLLILRCQLYMFRTITVHPEELLFRCCMCRLWYVYVYICKGKVHRRTGNEGPEGE